MKNILLLMGRYLPGHKDGGPLRTMINVTEALGDEYQFYIACYDRDHGDTVAYPGIMYDKWNIVGKAKVFYVKPGEFTQNLILELAKNKDVIYLTNFYEEYGYKTLILKRMGKIICPVALASMGVFSKEAQKKKILKKKIFIIGCKILGLFKDITWSVTSELEANDVKRVIGENIQYVVAEDLPRTNIPGISKSYDGYLKIVFLSRICEHKNPELLIDALLQIKNINNIKVGFYGPIQEIEYWNKCLNKLEKSSFKWVYGGDIPSEDVQNILSHYDIFVLPSQSENYGHVIFEALSVGCIPVISDRTPWSDLEKEKAGFICEMNASCFTKTIEKIQSMQQKEINMIKNNAVEYAKRKVQQSKKNTGYRKIFTYNEKQ